VDPYGEPPLPADEALGRVGTKADMRRVYRVEDGLRSCNEARGGPDPEQPRRQEPGRL